jgi:hypothetical protein
LHKSYQEYLNTRRAEQGAKHDKQQKEIAKLTNNPNYENAPLTTVTPPTDRDRWYEEILDTLSRLHQAGLSHNDVKPLNLMMWTIKDQPRMIFMIDFGLLDMLGNLSSVARQTPEFQHPMLAQSYMNGIFLLRIREEEDNHACFESFFLNQNQLYPMDKYFANQTYKYKRHG